MGKRAVAGKGIASEIHQTAIQTAIAAVAAALWGQFPCAIK
jgi:hypothetical protein